ncbi:hypothetical protein ADIARSV_1397 [Arcticibacter svalbardensis MN12-7]|uniref:Uncharacterized protein n=1 Tax=Arcticibacter svalbardensis MN12-7 TaxID=1150600 RepID=R9GUI7_9SPHI|nr:hypothetical protein ADIARSV_1397 [Arcticibacter svalbardensis MN12-7]
MYNELNLQTDDLEAEYIHYQICIHAHEYTFYFLYHESFAI